MILDKVTLDLKVMTGYTFKLLVVSLTSISQYRIPNPMTDGQ